MAIETKTFFASEERGAGKAFKVIKNYEGDVVLMKPAVDASDKEIYRRNGMGGPAETLKHLVHAKDRIIAQESTFFPQEFA